MISFGVSVVSFTSPAMGGDRIPLAIRGSAIVHLLPDSDTLRVRVQKRDLNIYEGEDVVVVRLLAPDRTVVASVTIPDDGNAKKGGGERKVQTRVLSAAVTQPGVYRLHVMLQGTDQVFGFEANCRRFLIEGPMFLNDYTLSGEVYFLPPKGEFSTMAEAVHNPGVQKLSVYDGAGKVIDVLDLAKVKVPATFTAEAAQAERGKPWRIRVERQDVQIKIKGVGYWSTSADSFFPLGKTRWMLTPYSVRVFMLPGESRSLRFELRNGSTVTEDLWLSVEGGGPTQCRILSPAKPARLRPGETTDVRMRVALGGDAAMGQDGLCLLKAAYSSDPEMSVGSSIRVHVGQSPAGRPLELPIRLKPYEHENAQFGYAPRYPPNAVFFDLKNRPFIRTRTGDRDRSTGIHTLVDGVWAEKPFLPALRAKYPNFVGTRRAAGWHGTKTVFDRAGDLYTLLQIRLADRTSRWLLLYSTDAATTFQVYELPKGTPDIKQWTGHNVPDGPPAIVIYTNTGPHPGRWASVHDLKLFLPRKEKGRLALGEPVLVSKRCFGTCQHSGGPAPTVTRRGRTHIAWGEVDDTGAPGVPTYVATYDHQTGELGRKVLLAHAPPVNDVHNAPGICSDSKGYLHVVTGSHGRPFKYVRSLKPNDAHGGWTEPVEVLETGSLDKKTGEQRGRQTYLSLVCDSRDTLHIAFRQWRGGVEPYFGGSLYAALSYQRKVTGKPWKDARPLVVPPLPGYSIYYHKLTLDRCDRLYLSYSYYSADQSYRDELPGQYDYRAVITSSDRGDSWKLAETSDFLEGVNLTIAVD